MKHQRTDAYIIMSLVYYITYQTFSSLVWYTNKNRQGSSPNSDHLIIYLPVKYSNSGTNLKCFFMELNVFRHTILFVS